MNDTPGDDRTRSLPPGMTRDCVEPWEYLEFSPNGDVKPCCARPPVGNLAHSTLTQIQRANPMKRIKLGLLTGQMDSICRHCRIAPPVEPDVLIARVRELMQAIGLPAGFDAEQYYKANPDVAQSKMSAEQHFLGWGRLAGRPLKP